MARNQSSDLRRNLYRNKIFKKILTENTLEFLALWRDFLGSLRLEILEEIFYEMLLRKK